LENKCLLRKETYRRRSRKENIPYSKWEGKKRRVENEEPKHESLFLGKK